jgi:hypothetical protein
VRIWTADANVPLVTQDYVGWSRVALVDLKTYLWFHAGFRFQWVTLYTQVLLAIYLLSQSVLTATGEWGLPSFWRLLTTLILAPHQLRLDAVAGLRAAHADRAILKMLG